MTRRSTQPVLVLASLLLSLCLVAFPAAPARASSNMVATCDETALRSTISGAAPGATITFGCSGTITLTGSPLDLYKDLTIDGSGHQVTLSGGGLVQVVSVNGVTVTLRNLTITGGSASNGGGISNTGTLTVANSTVVSNTVVGGGNGGGILNGGTLTVTNSVIGGNNSDNFGGGIENNSGTLKVTNSIIASNTALYGGGIFSTGTVTLTTSTISGNGAQGGGGLFSSGAMTVTNSTITGNSAPTFGGGIAGEGGTMTLTNNTIAGNSSASGSGIFLDFTTATASASIFAANTGGNCIGAFTDGGGNVDDATTCGLGVQSRSSTDPQLAPLADNGGPLAGAPGTAVTLQTMALPTGSPAIGIAACLLSTDERGVARPGTGCDSGAYQTSQGGCLVQGGVQQVGVGSLSITHLQTPARYPGSVLGLVGGLLTVRAPQLTACSTSGSVHTATIIGTAGGASRSFPPGTALTLTLQTTPDGAATVTIAGGTAKSVTLVGGSTTSRSRLTISSS